MENLSHSPVEVNKADVESLLRIPGVGVIGARKILAARREKNLTSLRQLAGLGISIKRAEPFVLLNGKRPEIQLELNL